MTVRLEVVAKRLGQVEPCQPEASACGKRNDELCTAAARKRKLVAFARCQERLRVGAKLDDPPPLGRTVRHRRRQTELELPPVGRAAGRQCRRERSGGVDNEEIARREECG
jgi:hypothetical protein